MELFDEVVDFELEESNKRKHDQEFNHVLEHHRLAPDFERQPVGLLFNWSKHLPVEVDILVLVQTGLEEDLVTCGAAEERASLRKLAIPHVLSESVNYVRLNRGVLIEVSYVVHH